MNQAHICMFCRYRKRLGALAQEGCCPAEEVSSASLETGERQALGMGRAIPERLRSPHLPQRPAR